MGKLEDFIFFSEGVTKLGKTKHFLSGMGVSKEKRRKSLASYSSLPSPDVNIKMATVWGRLSVSSSFCAKLQSKFRLHFKLADI